MTHSRSYPVTKGPSVIQPHGNKGASIKQAHNNKGANTPQPHVKYSENNWMNCSGWLPFLTAGAMAWCILICIYVLGARMFFPAIFNPNNELVPIVQKGFMQVYPFFLDMNYGVESHYFSHLPPKNLTGTATALSDLLTSYPKTHGDVYKNCWLEKPNGSNPCFYDSSWIADVCTTANSYGYEENNGYFSPCFIVKFDQTQDWKPLTVDFVPSYITEKYDHGFMPVHCYAKDTSKSLNITVYPPKGFSLLFFPVSKFDSKKYLAPLVAVKVDGIRKGQNVTVECSVITPNAFVLWNNGKAVIHFTSDSS